MDNRLRRNEICIIGMPRCDFVFASTRSCFIGYGFTTSALETTILKSLLEKRGIEPVEAGGKRNPGENAFCVKICSKIITSQFCCVLVNNDVVDGNELPNPNVNMEYGLMLGFNKYVIPFQRAEQKLPFNIAGLDTIKYTNDNFSSLAESAIEQALKKTTPAVTKPVDLNQRIHAFVLTQEATLVRLDTLGDKAISDLGSPLGFVLLGNFAGTDYIFFGNFTYLRPEAVVWRLRMLYRAIDGRRSSWATRVSLDVMTETQAKMIDQLFSRFRIWLIVNSDADRDAVKGALEVKVPAYTTVVYSLQDIERTLQELGGSLV